MTATPSQPQSPCIASLGAAAIAAQNRHHHPRAPPTFFPTTSPAFNLALDVGAPGAVAPAMAQPNAEPVEDYEYVAVLPCPLPGQGRGRLNELEGADTATVMNRSRPTSRCCRTWLPALSPALPSTAQVSRPPFLIPEPILGSPSPEASWVLTSCSVPYRCHQGEQPLRPCRAEIPLPSTSR